ncbi:MAG: ActS/PrrB/RegB family redox-sensitive histidine kinase [Rhodobacteraceae bacterium]|nr:ActS/PrrB/RegB family redox-sensitive histidine kinase [Paracoccaceae bacterium]
MANPTLGLFHPDRRVNWVRLRTLVMLRWISVVGQSLAILVAVQSFDIDLDLGLCILAIAASVVANLFAIFLYPQNTRLSEVEVSMHLVFDMAQLSFLLFLTGGLDNPFALLIMVPVTISATALKLPTTVLLGALAILLVTLVTWVNVPLRTSSGEILQKSDLFIFGFWAAIVLGVNFLAAFAQRVTSEIHAMSDALSATQMALEREQKLTDLGGVVAAAAHELGTPLATIKLVSTELLTDLADRPDLIEDAQLIGEQADRCRDILRSMGRAGKDDLQLKQSPVAAIVREAAEPHEDRGPTIHYDMVPFDGADARQPVIERRPEIVHGLRNLIQNAVDFAKSSVWIDILWSDTEITFRVTDDGPGYPLQILSRIGDPFVRLRRTQDVGLSRPEYEGMGLGLFIAKTLLERSGAEMSFANARDPYEVSSGPGARTGAVVQAKWPRAAISASSEADSGGLGVNKPIEI